MLRCWHTCGDLPRGIFGAGGSNLSSHPDTPVAKALRAALTRQLGAGEVATGTGYNGGLNWLDEPGTLVPPCRP